MGLGQEGVHQQGSAVFHIRIDRRNQGLAVDAVRQRLADLQVAQDRVWGGVVFGRNFLDDLDLLLDFLDRLDDLRLDDLDLFLDLNNLRHNLLDNLRLRGRAGGQDHADDQEYTEQYRQLLERHLFSSLSE